MSQTGNKTHTFIPSINLQLSCFLLLLYFRISYCAGHIRNDVSSHSEFECLWERNVVAWGGALGFTHSHGFFDDLEAEILVGFVLVAAEDEWRCGRAGKLVIVELHHCLRFRLLFAPHSLLLQLQSWRMETLITQDCQVLIDPSERAEFENQKESFNLLQFIILICFFLF